MKLFKLNRILSLTLALTILTQSVSPSAWSLTNAEEAARARKMSTRMAITAISSLAIAGVAGIGLFAAGMINYSNDNNWSYPNDVNTPDSTAIQGLNLAKAGGAIFGAGFMGGIAAVGGIYYYNRKADHYADLPANAPSKKARWSSAFYTQSATGEEDENTPPKDCLICTQEGPPKDFIRLHCHETHEFHERCIKQWYERNDICPTCRENITNAEDTQKSIAAKAVAATAARAAAQAAQASPASEVELVEIRIDPAHPEAVSERVDVSVQTEQVAQQAPEVDEHGPGLAHLAN